MATRKASPVKKWKPASDEWTRAFDAALPAGGPVERRKMFGYPAAFVNGNMAAGLHESGLVLRLAESDRQELIKLGGTPFEPMAGRVMKEYVVAPASLASQNEALRDWVGRALAHAGGKPAKAKKKR